ncbi:hypothetical protein BPOR_0484g00060 [Botrytis porri]|uniref:Uncharacterized protein n=1 Tax=Botrytis porri TaxID=87229 RepID=A0A4Z1KRJ2_9HELO|nr:hypothetical protein BPOR_0484g00060 [Botrytis porri]
MKQDKSTSGIATLPSDQNIYASEEKMIIALDFGTTYSSIAFAFLLNENPEVLGAARKAGIYPVTLVKVPEAAALYALTEFKDKALSIGDAFVICDAGGGTVDLISYEIVKLNPRLELRELVPGTGSLNLNSRFEEVVKELVGEARFHDPKNAKAFAAAFKKFDSSLEPFFRCLAGDKYTFIFLRAKLKDDVKRGLVNKVWTLKSNDIKLIFDPIIADIMVKVNKQVQDDITKRLSENHPKAKIIKAIILVGGFGSSEYLNLNLIKSTRLSKSSSHMMLGPQSLTHHASHDTEDIGYPKFMEWIHAETGKHYVSRSSSAQDSQDVQYGGSVQQAVELVGKMLEQTQIELEKMLSQHGEVPIESQKRYKDLDSNYQKISEELKAFGRQTASVSDKSGQVQAELNLAQAKKDIEILKAEVENLEAQCNDLKAQAHQPPQNVQELQTKLEEIKNQNIELQRKKVEMVDKDLHIWRRMVSRYNLMESSGPMHMFKPEYHRIVKMEAGLAAFEKKIRDASEGDDHMVSNVKLVLANDAAGDIHKNLDYYNWRKLTYRCGKSIRKRVSERRIGVLSADLEYFLRPLPEKNYKHIEERILMMCKEAFIFGQTLRAEPLESYKIYFPEPGDPIVFSDRKELNTMEIWGQEGGYPADEAGTVAYTYLGGLAFADNHKQEWYPLATAKVVVKSEEERSW